MKQRKRKLLSAATSVVCGLSMLSYLPQLNIRSEASELVSNDFEVTYGGWYSNTDFATLIAKEGAGYKKTRGMVLTERTTSEDGVSSSKGFYLVGEVEYTYSVMVRSEQADTFHLSLLCIDAETGEETVVELAEKEVKAGEWTKLSAKYTAPENSYEFKLTINTDSTSDFAFDDVKVTGDQDETLVYAAGNGLKDAYKGYGFRVGNILNGQTVNNSGIKANYIKDFDAIECENETKPDATLVQSGSTNTDIKVRSNSFAAIADFCVQNNMGFRGHVMVWHSQTPEWFFKDNFQQSGNWVSTSVMDQRLESYIKNVFNMFATQYPTLNLYSYDIVNEAVSDDTNRTANNGGARTPGYGNGASPWVQVYGSNAFIEKAFTYARQYAPEGCKLYYNDYNEYWDHKKNCIINTILKPLSQKGVLDGMGMQSHIDAGTNTFSGTVPYLNALDEYLSLGIDVQLTEIDVSLENGQTLQDQSNKYAAIFKHVQEVNTSGKYKGKVTLVQLWGPNDANTWINGDKSPLVYDKNNQPKLAYTTLMAQGDGNGPFDGFDSDPVPLEVDSDGYWFHSTFEGSTDNWSGRGAASVETSGRYAYADKEALLVSGREAEWNGTTYTLSRAFEAGQEYSFSVNATYADGDASRTFKLTLEYVGSDGETTWDEIATGTTSAGQWVQLANTNYKLPADGSSFKIIVETNDGTLENFYIDEAIGAPAGTVIKGAGQPTITTTAKPVDPSSALYGDVNVDGKIDTSDVVLFNKSLKDDATLSAEGKLNADVDGDGEVASTDIAKILKYLAGIINYKELAPANVTVKDPSTETDDSNVTNVDTNAMASLFSSITPLTSYKQDGESNPLYTTRFGADPGFLEYNGRLYVYTTNDAFEYDSNGSLKENSYDVGTINCLSSADLVNWTDHGAIPVAGRNGRTTNGAASWAFASWAPDACVKKINGKDKFFLYFANSGGGIGVLTADSPEGPWTDPLGHALVTGSSPNCSDVVWMFDPGVFVDDDGTGYLYFGGGVDGKDKSNPKTGRCVKLGDDMISLAGTPVTMETPYLFEDSSIIKIGNTYYYSYCANWNVPSGCTINGNTFGSADICYMTSDNPLGPWTSANFQGAVFKNTGSQGLDKGGNNHHSIVSFKNKYYVLYHTRIVENRMGINKNYRSPSISEATITNGKISCAGSHKGVSQLENLDGTALVQAETMSNQSTDIVVNGLGNTTVSGKKGAWFSVNGVSCGSATKITMKGSSNKNAVIKVCKGSAKGDVVAYIPLSSTNEEVTVKLNGLSGTQNLYFVMSDEATVDYWTLK